MKLLKASDRKLKGEQDFSGNIRKRCPLLLTEHRGYEGKYEGQVVYIVGKGPSLDFVTPSIFRSDSPIICINESYKVIKGLRLPNPIFFTQCDRPVEYYVDDTDIKILPHLVAHFYKQFKNVYVFEANIGRHLTSNLAIHFAYYLGAAMLELVSFDAFIGKEGYSDNVNCKPFKMYHLEHVADIKKEIKIPFRITCPNKSK